jgi:hypothetical protein
MAGRSVDLVLSLGVVPVVIGEGVGTSLHAVTSSDRSISNLFNLVCKRKSDTERL